MSSYLSATFNYLNSTILSSSPLLPLINNTFQAQAINNNLSHTLRALQIPEIRSLILQHLENGKKITSKLIDFRILSLVNKDFRFSVLQALRFMPQTRELLFEENIISDKKL